MAGALGNLLIMLTADTAQARSDIGKAAHQVERDMAEMQRNAVAAGVVIAEAIGQIAGSFARAAKDAIEFGDALNKMSQKTNFSVERLSEMAFAAELADVSVSQLNTGMGMFNKVLADAAKQGSKASELFKALGVDITQGPQVAFEQFAKAINALPDGETKVAAMRVAFGRTGDALIPMLAGLDEATQKAQQLGLVMSQQMAQDSERFKDSLTVLGTVTRSLALTAMEPLTHWLANVGEGMAKARVEGNLFKNIMLETGMAVASFSGRVAEFLGMESLAARIESEFRTLHGVQKEMGVYNAVSGKIKGPDGKPINPEQLACAVSGGKWIDGKCVRAKPKTGKSGSTKRDDNLLGRQLQEDMDEWAKIMSEAAAATDKYNQKVREREAAEVKAEINIQVERAKAIEQMEEILAQNTLLYNGFDETGKKIVETTKKTTDWGKELGFTFSSAFEDAIVAGKKFSDVLRGLAQDIARIIIRKSVTEPLGAAISEGIGKVFSFDGGGFTGSGARSGGLDGQGGFMAMLHPNETVVDHTKGGGVGGGTVINQTINFSANTPAAVRDAVFAMMPVIQQQTVAAVQDQRNRTGDRR